MLTPRKKFGWANHIMFGSGTPIKHGGVKHHLVETVNYYLGYSTTRASTQSYFMDVPDPKRNNMVASTKLFSGCNLTLAARIALIQDRTASSPAPAPGSLREGLSEMLPACLPAQTLYGGIRAPLPSPPLPGILVSRPGKLDRIKMANIMTVCNHRAGRGAAWRGGDGRGLRAPRT